MLDLQQLLRPTWSVEITLNKFWSILTTHEKETIAARIDSMFEHGFPFQLKHDKILYIHLFSLLANLEIIGLHGLLISLKEITDTDLAANLRLQIMDECFHAMVFAKIACELSAPHALPPTDSKEMDSFITLLINESDIKTSLIWINLLGEGWVEEIFLAMKENHIAPQVLDVIMDDESRHRDDLDLYLKVGLPDRTVLNKNLTDFESELIRLTFSQKKYTLTFATLLGTDGLLGLIKNIDKKHHALLRKINAKPGKNWRFFMKNTSILMQSLFHDNAQDNLVAQTNTRKLLSAAWTNPSQPTQYGLFSINISPLKFFEKKYPKETITGLFLQATSKALLDYPVLKNYKAYHSIYNAKDSYVGLAVQLPDCGDQLSMIEFKNCHEMSLPELYQHIQNDSKILSYCYKKTQELQLTYPSLGAMIDQMCEPLSAKVYPELALTRPVISISNIGHFGYDLGCSPLLPDETVKLLLTKIERKQLWNKEKQVFEIQDVLPVGISVDHRVFDANIPVPKYLQAAFNDVFQTMQTSTPLVAEAFIPNTQLNAFIEFSEQLLAEDLEFGFKYLFYAAQIWKNHARPLAETKKESFLDGLKKSLGFSYEV